MKNHKIGMTMKEKLTSDLLISVSELKAVEKVGTSTEVGLYLSEMIKAKIQSISEQLEDINTRNSLINIVDRRDGSYSC